MYGDPDRIRLGGFKLFPLPPQPFLERQLEEGLKFQPRAYCYDLVVLEPHLVEQLSQEPVALLGVGSRRGMAMST